MPDFKNFIGGNWVPPLGGEYFENRNPADFNDAVGRFPLSGAAFMVDPFPKAAQDWLLLVPMVNGAEMMRDGYFGSLVRSHYDAGYLALWCLGLTVFGLAQTRIVSRTVSPE